VQARARMLVKVQAELKKAAKSVAAQVAELRSDIGKAASDDARNIIKKVKLDWRDLTAELLPIYESIAKDGVNMAARQLQPVFAVSLEQANKEAIAWSEMRSAELIGKKVVNGKLVDNPKAEWSITDSTRDMIQSDVTRALDEGLTVDELSDLLEENYAFSPARAEMIARTETAMADVTGNIISYREAEGYGITIFKQWVTANDDLVSEDCAMNGESEPIPMDDIFPSGAMWPPEHPNCRCDIVPVVQEDD
jgi:SPP1 gp7 family putative phage head morphogenesis protein